MPVTRSFHSHRNHPNALHASAPLKCVSPHSVLPSLFCPTPRGLSHSDAAAGLLGGRCQHLVSTVYCWITGTAIVSRTMRQCLTLPLLRTRTAHGPCLLTSCCFRPLMYGQVRHRTCSRYNLPVTTNCLCAHKEAVRTSLQRPRVYSMAAAQNLNYRQHPKSAT